MSGIKTKLLNWYPKYFARRMFFNFNNTLIDFGLRGIGIMNHIDNEVTGEKYFSEYVMENYRPKIIFDVGAHKGDFAALFSRSNSIIHCFEPNEKPHLNLEMRFRKKGNINVHNMGFSDKIEECYIFDHSNDFGSVYASVYEDVITKIHNSTSVKTKINLSTINDFAKSHEINKIDLLKIDTEGHDLSILKGASNLIANQGIDIILFEFNEMNIISRSFLKDFISILENYDLYRLLPGDFLPIDYKYPHKFEIFAFQNIVAFRKDINKLS
jgi:FkbM family methyltransferase